MVAQNRLEGVERCAGAAGPGECGGDFARVRLVLSEPCPVFLERLEGGTVVPAPRFRLSQFDPDRRCAWLDAEVATVGVGRGVSSSGRGADPSEAEQRVMVAGLQRAQAAVGVLRPI